MSQQKGVWFKSSLNVVIALAASVTAAWSHPQTQDLKGVVASGNGSPIAGAVCTLKGIGLPAEGIGVTTNERGEFDFPGLEPREYDLVCVAVGHLPAIEAGLRVAAENPTLLQIVLPESEKLRQSVEVHESATPLATENTPSTGHVNTQQLSTLPLVRRRIPGGLAPGSGGGAHAQTARSISRAQTEGQSMLLVDDTEMVDPITGSYSIDLPPDAIESLDVSKTPYNAEYGHFSGGLTTVVTKPPSEQMGFSDCTMWCPRSGFEAGHLSGVDGNSPRIRFTGPLNSDRLTMSESFTYFMHKQIVRGLPWPHDQTIQQGVNSFTNFQYVVSSEHLLTFNLHVFPDRQEWADSDSLVPQTASSNYGQRGFSVGTQGPARVRVGRTAQHDAPVHSFFQLRPRTGNHRYASDAQRLGRQLL